MEATFGTDGLSDTDGATGGDTDDPEDFCIQGDGSLNASVENPVRYQCNGEGVGLLRWEQCGLGCGIEGESDVAVAFPPGPEDDPELNAQICCEPNLDEALTATACVDDCARAACNEAIATIVQRIEGLETFLGCNDKCVGRTEAALVTWRDFLVENYADCLHAARNPGLPLVLPNADIELQVGAVYNGELDLDCTVTADAVESADACEENFNPEDEPPEGTGWTCGVTGFASLDQKEDATTTAVSGTVSYRRGDCGSAGECWFQVNELELRADPVKGEKTTLRSGVSELGFPVFGSYDTSTDEGSAAKLMLGMDATAYVMSARGKLSQYDFRMKNSKSTAFEVAKGAFRVKEAVFSWSTGETVTLDLKSTSCTQI